MTNIFDVDYYFPVYRSTTVYESKNYYNIAHELKEDVKQQPSILVGGTLKEYQVSAEVKLARAIIGCMHTIIIMLPQFSSDFDV